MLPNICDYSPDWCKFFKYLVLDGNACKSLTALNPRIIVALLSYEKGGFKDSPHPMHYH